MFIKLYKLLQSRAHKKVSGTWKISLSGDMMFNLTNIMLAVGSINNKVSIREVKHKFYPPIHHYLFFFTESL